MLTLIAQNWWLYVLRGFLALGFGMMALLWPGLTLRVLVTLFGAYVLLEGVLALGSAFKYRTQKSPWPLLVRGVAGILAAIFAFILPGLAAAALLIFIAVWAILTGILETYAAVHFRRKIKGEWVLGLAGILSVLIGILLIINPGAGALAVVWLIGIYAIILGWVLIYFGFKVRDPT
ncbi:MAG: HdeD family acid-resistance protein [Deltaproteobacteria bacterium]